MRFEPLLVSLTLAASLAQAETITLTLQEYPPYMGEKIPYQGLLTRAVLAAFDTQGIEVILKPVPNNRAIEGARRGAYDGSFGWARNPDREKDLLYTNPVISLQMVFCHRSNQQYPWKKMADLAPFAIGITTGNFYSDDFSKLQTSGVLKVDAAASDAANFKKLLAGHIDLFPIDAEVAPYLMAMHLTKAERPQITCQKKAYWEAPLHVVINKKNPNAERWIAAFNAGLAKLEKSGQLQQLFALTREEIYQTAQKP